MWVNLPLGAYWHSGVWQRESMKTAPALWCLRKGLQSVPRCTLNLEAYPLRLQPSQPGNRFLSQKNRALGSVTVVVPGGRSDNSWWTKHWTASRLGHSPPVFLWKRLFCSGPRGRPQVWGMSSGLRSYSKETEVISPLSLCLAPAHQCLTEKCLYSFQEPWFLQLPRGHLQIVWLWCQQGLCLWSHWPVYTCILLKAATRVWLQSAWF